MHPVAVIMVIVIASNYFGLWGVILGPPFVALIRDLAVHFAREWNRPPGSGEQESEVEAPEELSGAEAADTSDTDTPEE